MAVERKIDQIISACAPNEQSSRLDALADELITGQVTSQCVSFALRIMGSDIPQQLSRQSMNYFVNVMKNLPSEVLVDVGTKCIEEMRTRLGFYDEADAIIRQLLFDYYVSVEEHREAAQVLSGINLDSSGNTFTPEQKVDVLIKIAECFLMIKETSEAEIFTNKSSVYMNEIDPNNVEIQLRYRATVAQVFDGNRKFIEAALMYYELSQFQNSNIVPEDLLQLLAKAVTCAILGTVFAFDCVVLLNLVSQCWMLT
mgnify:CR=1 FL=1